MGSRKNRTVKKKRGGSWLDKKLYDVDKNRYENEKKLAEDIKKKDPSVKIVLGKDLKPGCTYTFVDPSVYNKEFIVESIRKNSEEGPKFAAGEEYLMTNKGWWMKEYPIGGNERFVQKKCGLPVVKSTTNKSRRKT